MVVDLLFASAGIEAAVVRAAELIEIVPGLIVPVASTGHLIALKLLARDDAIRPQDLSDLRALCEVASPTDLADAHEAVTLISDRGFARGRDLVAGLGHLPVRRSTDGDGSAALWS